MVVQDGVLNKQRKENEMKKCKHKFEVVKTQPFVKNQQGISGVYVVKNCPMCGETEVELWTE